MRVASLTAVAVCVCVAACDWKSGQANSAQGNISQDSRPPATAKSSEVTNNATNAMAMLAVPLAKDKALATMKARHDGMEAIGDATKASHRALGGTPDLATVRTRLVGKSGEIPVDYRLHRLGERWLVYDVSVEGISLVANYRAQFETILRTSSPQALVARLRARQQ